MGRFQAWGRGQRRGSTESGVAQRWREDGVPFESLDAASEGIDPWPWGQCQDSWAFAMDQRITPAAGKGMAELQFLERPILPL